MTHGFQEVFGHAGALQDDAHEGEEGDGQQSVVLHDAKNAQGQRLEHGAWKNITGNADESKCQTSGCKAKRHGKACEQKHKQADEHQRHKLLCQKSGLHLFFSSQHASGLGFELFEFLLIV